MVRSCDVGTSIRLLDQSTMESLFTNYRDEMFYLGNAYGTSIRCPCGSKHFGKSQAGQRRVEAYHIGVFGKTGPENQFLQR